MGSSIRSYAIARPQRIHMDLARPYRTPGHSAPPAPRRVACRLAQRHEADPQLPGDQAAEDEAARLHAHDGREPFPEKREQQLMDAQPQRRGVLDERGDVLELDPQFGEMGMLRILAFEPPTGSPPGRRFPIILLFMIAASQRVSGCGCHARPGPVRHAWARGLDMRVVSLFVWALFRWARFGCWAWVFG